MAFFAQELALALGILMMLALMGGFVVIPHRRPYGLLMAPLAGLAVLSLGTAALYVVCRLPFAPAAILTVLAASAVTVVLFWRAGAAGHAWRTAGLIIVVVAALAVSIHCAPTIAAGSFAIWGGNGTDEMNYAHVADWMRQYPVEHLRLMQYPPYEAVPRFLLAFDTRLGAFSFVAFVSLIAGRTAVFAFDLAAAVAWSAAVFGVAGALARRPLTLAVLVVGLAAASWLDFSRAGFLGKLLGYPAALMIAILFISARMTTARLFTLLVLAIGAASFHFGFVTALLVAIVCVPFVAGVALRGAPAWPAATQRAISLCILLLVIMASTGIFSHSYLPLYPAWPVPRSALVPIVADVETLGSATSNWAGATFAVAIFAFALWVPLFAIAIRMRSLGAAALLLGPALLVLAFYAAGADRELVQIVSVFYATTLCGAAMLLDQSGPSLRWKIVVAVLIVCAVAVRVPRAVGQAYHFGWQAYPGHVYSKSMVDQIAAEARGQPVTIDTVSSYLASFARAELMRRPDIKVAWTERAAQRSGHPGPLPAPASDSGFILSHPSDPARVDATVVWRSPSLVLMRR